MEARKGVLCREPRASATHHRSGNIGLPPRLPKVTGALDLVVRYGEGGVGFALKFGNFPIQRSTCNAIQALAYIYRRYRPFFAQKSALAPKSSGRYRSVSCEAFRNVGKSGQACSFRFTNLICGWRRTAGMTVRGGGGQSTARRHDFRRAGTARRPLSCSRERSLEGELIGRSGPQGCLPKVGRG